MVSLPDSEKSLTIYT